MEKLETYCRHFGFVVYYQSMFVHTNKWEEKSTSPLTTHGLKEVMSRGKESSKRC